MSGGWIAPLAAALGAASTVLLLSEHLGRGRRHGHRRLERLRLTSGPSLPTGGARVGRTEPSAGRWRGLSAALVGRRQLRKLEEQLEQALVTMTHSLRAGLSLVQALEVAEREAVAPLGGDLAGVLAEYRVGRPLDECLEQWSRRRRSSDLVFFSRAIAIHRRAGGDLGLVLSNLAETVRERRMLRVELQAKTAEARVTAAVLVAIVPALALYISFFQPAMLTPLFVHPLGRVGLGYAILSWLVGAVLAARLARLPAGEGYR